MALLVLNPNKEIVFPTEPTEITTQVTVVLELKNTTDYWVAYKMKTTAPLYYLVRLSNGVIAPKASTSIQIIQKPMNQAALYTQHRFLVQSVKSDETGPNQNVKAVWERADKAQVQEQRLGVFFSSVNNQSTTVEGQYQELVQYVEGLELKKKMLREDLASPAGNRGKSSASSSSPGGFDFTLQHIIVAVLVTLIITKIHDIMF